MDQNLLSLQSVIESRKGAAPSESYVAKLFFKGQDAILKKIGEESAELIMASKDGVAGQIIYESADLLFHLMVLLSHHGLSVKQVLEELERREGVSGLAEKSSRQSEDK